MTEYPRWNIRFRIGSSAVADLPATLRVDLQRDSERGWLPEPIWNASPAVIDLTYTGVPLGLSDRSRELASGLVSAAFTLTSDQLGPSDRDSLVLSLRITAPGLRTVVERVVLKMRDGRRYELTSTGRAARDKVVDLALRREVQHAFGEPPAFDASRPDVDPAEAGGGGVGLDLSTRLGRVSVGEAALAKWRARFRHVGPWPPPRPSFT